MDQAEHRDDPNTYPLILTNLAHVRCVVVGGGAVAERKVGELLEGGARPHVISPQLTAQLAAWRDAGRIEHRARVYGGGELHGAFLVIAATGDRGVNAAIAEEGVGLGLLVNVADEPAVGNFHTAATVRRGDLLIAVSTGGASPALSARIRRELAERYGDEYARLLALLRRLRDGPARQLGPPQRASLWRGVVAGPVLGWLRGGEEARAEAYVCEQIAALREAEPRRRGERTKL
jgi:precorrin-2 dehydrogenase / sirohydrochlorin ferrochelatase